MDKKLGINWPISDKHGWGVFALNLLVSLLFRKSPLPILLTPAPEPLENILPEGEMRNLVASIDGIARELREKLAENPGKIMTMSDATVLHALGNRLFSDPELDRFQGGRNLGMVFLEETDLDAAAVERGRRYDCILGGSTWCAASLKSSGLESARVLFQGVDITLFNPAEVADPYPGRFVVFSGGKLEYRKGQDIVLAAFRIFRERHPEALLLTSWQNLWLESAASIAEGPHVDRGPEAADGNRLFIEAWTREMGLPEGAVIDLGWISNRSMPDILRGCDAAVFTNRCEGGTNLVAMEAMACGVPCVISANTGHLDLIDAGENCYPLNAQGSLAAEGGVRTGWAESSVEETVECLESIYRDREEAARRGNLGAKFMSGWNWRQQTEKLVEILESLS